MLPRLACLTTISTSLLSGALMISCNNNKSGTEEEKATNDKGKKQIVLLYNATKPHDLQYMLY